ncbi:Acetyltransferase (GNAT) domain-containing protein [Maribacter sedimenticola]|uniref:Acetyltransferase (GNAT) domain-containing protein n=1 Tax=Maribacter sedimenticola TaxID=228956 RepID=A0ABY1SER0_9FLAO|nr:GNAT family N-acetyltransferase [Maribacter sedimenticola]SNR30120.1 Acetyltransferase (GNAT) domain-containing protein [Maribacter sedimenticola]
MKYKNNDKILSITECRDNAMWNDFLVKESNQQMVTIAHNPCLGAILSKTFGYTYKNYFIKEGENTIGVLPTVSIGKKVVSMPHFSYGGPIFKKNYSSKVDYSLLLEENNFEIRSFEKLSAFTKQNKSTFIIPLNNDANEIFNGFSSRFRNKIRKPQKLGFTVTENGPDALKHFYQLYSKRMLQKGSPPLGKSFFYNLFNTYKNGEVGITVVYHNDKPVAAGFCLSYLNFKEFCWGSTDKNYNRYNVNAFLLWNMIENSINAGYYYFSLGRSTKNSHNHTYKLQFKPKEVPLYFNLSESPGISIKEYEFLTKIWKYQPLKTSQILGHYISKYIY